MSFELDHPLIAELPFESIPLNRDIFLMDEKWIHDYYDFLIRMLNRDECQPPGYVKPAYAREIKAEVIEISWFPRITDRYHKVSAFLPRGQFVTCIKVINFDENPHVFVTEKWINTLLNGTHSVFTFIDVIGMKSYLETNEYCGEKLIELRNRIDNLSSRNKE